MQIRVWVEDGEEMIGSPGRNPALRRTPFSESSVLRWLDPGREVGGSASRVPALSVVPEPALHSADQKRALVRRTRVVLTMPPTV